MPIGRGEAQTVLGLTPKRERPELGNIGIFAPTRAGKGLDAVTKILTWPHSIIINDIKGELYDQTAGYRSTIGEVMVLDPTGFGNQYDPYQGRTQDLDLKQTAAHLLYGESQGDNAIFLKRARTMQVQIAKAAILQDYPVFPYLSVILAGGLDEAVFRLQALSPVLATKFLNVSLENAELDDKFLVHSWGTLDTELDPLLSPPVISMLSKSDFRAGALLTSCRPITVYIRWPERYLLSLSPLTRLLWHSFLDELITTYDSLRGENCKPVLLLIDEAGRSAIPSLAEHATTVVGRGITLCLYFQSLAQLEAIYGANNAGIILDNLDTQIFYRPNRNRKTGKALEETLGLKSDYAHSEQSREGEEVSLSKQEQAIPLIPSYLLSQMGERDIIGFHRNFPPFRGKRLDWRDFPELRRRRAISAPPVPKRELPEDFFQPALIGPARRLLSMLPANPNGY